MKLCVFSVLLCETAIAQNYTKKEKNLSKYLLYENKLDLALATSGEHDVYENKLTIFPVNLCLIHRLKFADTKISSFTGAGFGLYFSEWEQKHFPENSNRTWLKGKENPVGIKFFTGFDFPVYHDLILNF